MIAAKAIKICQTTKTVNTKSKSRELPANRRTAWSSANKRIAPLKPADIMAIQPMMFKIDFNIRYLCQRQHGQ
jgi:hypothetical protein